MKSDYSTFQKHILDWYIANGRHDLPWRHTRDPYGIAVSEIMLQQTQVPRVITKWTSWMKRFPIIEDCARASVKDILDEWKGLGYNRRGLALKKLCEIVMNEHHGTLPKDYNKLLELPGIGSYTASAIRAFAWNIPSTIIETNIRSVFIHHFFNKEKSVRDKDILPHIEATIDRENPREWYYALMDYGSHLKKENNPSRKSAHFTKQSSFKGSNREQRSFLLDTIRAATSPTSQDVLREALRQHLGTRLAPHSNVEKYFHSIEQNLKTLTNEGFIELVETKSKSKENFYRIKQ